jgi:hypothetical protein
VGFSQFKANWKDLLDKNRHVKPTKATYLGLITKPYEKAFSSSNIKAGFKAVGLWPLDATCITPNMIAPSLATSTQTGFPLRLPSTPVRSLVQAMKDAMSVPVTVPALQLESLTEEMEALTIESSPQSLPLATFRDEPPVPLSSVATAAVEALKGSRSAFLVNNQPLALDQPPPTPYIGRVERPKPHKYSRKTGRDEKFADLELQLAAAKAENMQLSNDLLAANATSIMQHLHLNALINERAAATKSGRNAANLFLDGKGDILTDPGFAGRVRAGEEAKRASDQLKAQKRIDRAQGKQLKAGGDAAWKAYAAEYAAQKAEWDAKVASYRKGKIPAHIMRIKPQRTLKKLVIANWMRDNGGPVAGGELAVQERGHTRARNDSDEESEEFVSGDVTSVEEDEEEDESEE